MSIITLRDYQEECGWAIRDALDMGIQRQAVVLPTGSGKSIVIGQIPIWNPGQTYVLQHREELIKQNADEIAKANPNLSIGIEQGDNFASATCDVVMMSVQTVGREDSRRRDNFWHPKNLVVDEFHHSWARTYRIFLEHFGWKCSKKDRNDEPGRLLLGLSATPQRTDKAALDEIYDRVVYYKSVRWMIEQGYLVDIACERIVTNTSLDNVKISHGDFAERQLADTINTDERNSIIVNAYLQHTPNKKAIMFCADVAHVHSLTNLFCRCGVPAELVVASIGREQREAVLRRFASGETKVLIGCMVFTEGFNSPNTEVIGMARPTKSQNMYIQMLGRGMRVACSLDGMDRDDRLREIANSLKPRMTLLDFVDNSTKNNPVMLPVLFGMNKDLNLRKKTILEALREAEEVRKEVPEFDISSVTDVEQLAQIDTKTIRTNIWESFQTPKEIKSASKLGWQKHSDATYWISLSKWDLLTLRENAVGQWEAVQVTTAEVRDGKVVRCDPREKVLGTEDEFASMVIRADKFIANNFPDQLRLLEDNADWKKKEPTEKQIGSLKKFRYSVTQQGGKHYIHVKNGFGKYEKRILTRGFANQILAEKFRKIEKK